MKAEIRRGTEVLAWTTQASTAEFDGHLLLATPHLALAHESGLRMANNWGYDRLFAGAVIEAVGTPHEFQIVHGGLMLFRTGVAGIADFACIVINPEVAAPDLGRVIARTADMLKCSSLPSG